MPSNPIIKPLFTLCYLWTHNSKVWSWFQ